jgi:hypothetical protein
MFRLKLARVCAVVTTLCLLIVVAVALSGGPTNALLLFGALGALTGFGGWRAGKLEA